MSKRFAGFLAAAVVLALATVAIATTPARQIMFGPGAGITLTSALPAADSGSDTLVDTVLTRTAGNLLETRNNGSSKFKVDFRGTASFGATAATAGSGFANHNARNIPRQFGAAIDCAAGNLTPTVAQVLDNGLFTCATAQSVTLPTAQGASGIVQNLPGTPAVGDVFQIKLAENHATNTYTLAAGTGGTIYGIATITNGARTWDCRVTAVTGGSETYTCY